MRRVKLFGIVALTLSGIYLYTFPSANIPYFVVELAHIAGGMIFAFLLLLSLGGLRQTSSFMKLGWITLAIGTALGVALTFTGATRPMAPLLYGHIFLCASGVLFLITGYSGNRFQDNDTPIRFSAFRFTGFLIVALLVGGSAWATRELSWRSKHRISNPAMSPVSQDFEGQGINGDFFPSSVRTNTGKRLESDFFMQSKACERCHSDIYKQWNSSAHHFSSFNNQWYRKSIEYMQDVIGVKPTRWCAGCHDPALLFSGKFDKPVREIINTPEAQAGLGCVMCHSVSAVHSTMGQADFTLEYPALAKLAANENRFARALHDFLVYVNPEPHRRTFMKPFVREDNSEFCSSCHKVHLDTHVNNYRWVRGFNDYDNWQGSGVSGLGARSFYYPAKSMRCADCHMPIVDSKDAGNTKGKIHSHRFPGANTALPTVNEDKEQLEAVTQFLKNGILSVDIFGVSPAREEKVGKDVSSTGSLNTTFAIGEEGEAALTPFIAEVAPLSAPLDQVAAEVAPGETYRVDVVVRTRKLGHFFPGGTVDAFDIWLELEATDDAGRTIFSSGAVSEGGKGPVDPGAHFYRSLQIDAHGNPIDKRNAWATRSLVYVRLIPPGAADTVHYRLKVPPDARGKIHLKTRLQYRKFAWFNTQFAFAGERVPGTPAATPSYDDGKFAFTGDTSKVSGKIKAIPDLPIVTIAENTATLTVARNPRISPPVAQPKPDDWTRWNDYGIGLLLQGDLKGAEAAFTNVTRIVPDNPDGWVNIGRARLIEGNLAGARQVLDQALSLSPNLARARYFYSRILRSEGDYDGALAHLSAVIRQYPKDRVVRNDAGRILFLQKKYAEAVKEFEVVLAIDPEDVQAHYNLMLCFNGLGKQDRALEHEKRYLRFKADEAAQSITGPYRATHPEDNNERQGIHEHLSSPPSRKGGA
ncbi:MAG TPA: tetratricopeptide repeat protein [Terriglobia bacterium]|nr:tetratricopeptide repeat protein [Terriglobia bacterium]